MGKDLWSGGKDLWKRRVLYNICILEAVLNNWPHQRDRFIAGNTVRHTAKSLAVCWSDGGMDDVFFVRQ